MKDFNKKYSPSNFPYKLPEHFGEIKVALEECPGVYYVSVSNGNNILGIPEEFYIVIEGTSVISRDALTYGMRIAQSPTLYAYNLDMPDSGHYIVEYELTRYKIRNNIPVEKDKSLLTISRYAMEYHPDYFGEIPVPTDTPWGHTTRYRILAQGITWIETENANECLSIYYPIWEGDLSDFTKEQAKFLTPKKSIQSAFAFYSQKACCLPIFEIQQDNTTLKTHVIYPKLMNALWKYYPEFAALWNIREQSGLNDLSRQFLQEIGVTNTSYTEVENTIFLTEGINSDFLII